MNEQDLKRAMHDVMVASSPPPSMDPSRALGVARKVRSRRRATWTGVLVAVLVVGVGIGSAMLVPGSGPGLQMGNGGVSVTPTAVPSDDETKPPWPSGQTDRTQTNGARADKAVGLMNDLIAAVPSGYEAKQRKYPDPNYGGSDMQRQQAQIGSDPGEPEFWDYMAITPVTKGGATGRLLAESHTPGSRYAKDEPCALAQMFWGMSGDCTVMDVGGKKVGVVTQDTSGRGDFDQWAAFLHDDGTVVFIAQSLKFPGSQSDPLTQQVFTLEQLAALAVDPKFKLS